MFEDKKVLIVDDEEKSRLYLATVLTELYANIVIQVISTPVEALLVLTNQHFDAILLKVEMQNMSGLDLVAELLKQRKHFPVIFISACKNADHIQKAIRLNAVDYIDKPVNPVVLDHALRKSFEMQPGTPASVSSGRFCMLTDIDLRLVDTHEILYFKSHKRYSIMCLKDGTQVKVRYNLASLSKSSLEKSFLYVSRQYIVNPDYIKYLSPSNRTITLKVENNDLILEKIFPSVLSGLIKKYNLYNLNQK